MNNFAKKILAWYDQHGRKSLPWKNSSIPPDQSPYHIWLSEVMLQQTQVATVIPYYRRFVEKFPTLEALANSDLDDVLSLWSGLGYYARGRNLHKAATVMWQEYQAVPHNFETLLSLPGIGRSTAGAIMAQAFDQSFPILDGNVKRVLARYFAIEGWYGVSAVGKKLWEASEKVTPKKRIAEYTQAIMDIGALVCIRSKPRCWECPLSTNCIALATERVNELPHRKPKKVKPVKQAFLLCVLDKDHIQLVQRPPSGIWGGLWSFPEFTDEDSLMTFLSDTYSLEQSHTKLESFRHTFSHYHLDIHPHIVRLSDKMSSTKIMDAKSRFYDLSKQIDVGIAAPVQRILDHIIAIKSS